MRQNRMEEMGVGLGKLIEIENLIREGKTAAAAGAAINAYESDLLTDKEFESLQKEIKKADSEKPVKTRIEDFPTGGGKSSRKSTEGNNYRRPSNVR